MLWMDGKCQDGQGPCAEYNEKNCANTTSCSPFSIDDIPGNGCAAILTNQQPAMERQASPPLQQTATRRRSQLWLCMLCLQHGHREGQGIQTYLLCLVAFMGLSGSAASLIVVAGVSAIRRRTQKASCLPLLAQALCAKGDRSCWTSAVSTTASASGQRELTVPREGRHIMTSQATAGFDPF